MQRQHKRDSFGRAKVETSKEETCDIERGNREKRAKWCKMEQQPVSNDTVEGVKEEIEGKRKAHQQQIIEKKNYETATSTTNTRTAAEETENTWHIFTKRRRSKQQLDKQDTKKTIPTDKKRTEKQQKKSNLGKGKMDKQESRMSEGGNPEMGAEQCKGEEQYGSSGKVEDLKDEKEGELREHQEERKEEKHCFKVLL